MGCNSCYDECCPDEGQLCVDASFFVPESPDTDCEVNYLYFYDGNMSYLYLCDESLYFKTTSQAGCAENLSVNWYLPTDYSQQRIGKLTFNYLLEINPITNMYFLEVNSINLLGCDTTVKDQRLVSVTDSLCMVNTVFAGSRLDTSSTGPFKLTTPLGTPVSSPPIDVTFLGVKIGELTFTITSGGRVKVLIKSRASNPTYPAAAAPISEQIVSTSSQPGTGTAAIHPITQANMCLQLRANKNNLYLGSPNSDAAEMPDGTYEMCLTYKNCNGKFQNRSLIKIYKSGTEFKAFWGRDTSKARGPDKTLDGKSGTLVRDGDKAVIRGSDEYQSSEVTVCGTIEGVVNNLNDMVLHISEVMQSFNLSDIFDKFDSESNPVNDWEKATISGTPAQLCNTKLYISIKAVCWKEEDMSVPGMPGAGTPDTFPPSCCKGSLNPFAGSAGFMNGTAGSKNKIVVYKTQGFCTCEVVTMGDDPIRMAFKNTDNTFRPAPSRNITCCLTASDAANFQSIDEC